MGLAVVGAGVGRTGTHSLKLALERLIGGRCHHMVEILGEPEQIPGWIAAIDGKPVEWSELLGSYRALVDWPGASFWPELSAANPDALVLLIGPGSRGLVPERVEHDLPGLRPPAARPEAVDGCRAAPDAAAFQ